LHDGDEDMDRRQPEHPVPSPEVESLIWHARLLAISLAAILNAGALDRLVYKRTTAMIPAAQAT